MNIKIFLAQIIFFIIAYFISYFFVSQISINKSVEIIPIIALTVVIYSVIALSTKSLFVDNFIKENLENPLKKTLIAEAKMNAEKTKIFADAKTQEANIANLKAESDNNTAKQSAAIATVSTNSNTLAKARLDDEAARKSREDAKKLLGEAADAYIAAINASAYYKKLTENVPEEEYLDKNLIINPLEEEISRNLSKKYKMLAQEEYESPYMKIDFSKAKQYEEESNDEGNNKERMNSAQYTLEKINAKDMAENGYNDSNKQRETANDMKFLNNDFQKIQSIDSMDKTPSTIKPEQNLLIYKKDKCTKKNKNKFPPPIVPFPTMPPFMFPPFMFPNMQNQPVVNNTQPNGMPSNNISTINNENNTAKFNKMNFKANMNKLDKKINKKFNEMEIPNIRDNSSGNGNVNRFSNQPINLNITYNNRFRSKSKERNKSRERSKSKERNKSRERSKSKERNKSRERVKESKEGNKKEESKTGNKRVNFGKNDEYLNSERKRDIIREVMEEELKSSIKNMNDIVLDGGLPKKEEKKDSSTLKNILEKISKVFKKPQSEEVEDIVKNVKKVGNNENYSETMAKKLEGRQKETNKISMSEHGGIGNIDREEIFRRMNNVILPQNISREMKFPKSIYEEEYESKNKEMRDILKAQDDNSNLEKKKYDRDDMQMNYEVSVIKKIMNENSFPAPVLLENPWSEWAPFDPSES